MHIVISIKCTECDRKIEAPIKTDAEGKLYLADSIEKQQEGFYCHQDQPDSMKINCPCSNEVRLYY